MDRISSKSFGRKGKGEYVLDASFFINGQPLDVKGYTTPEVVAELKSVEAQAKWESLKDLVKIEEPLPYFIKKVRSTGDKLSSADISVLALALQKKLPLVTYDLPLQNAAAKLGVEVVAPRKIERVVRVVWECPVCKKNYERPGMCSCGSKLIRKVVSLKK